MKEQMHTIDKKDRDSLQEVIELSILFDFYGELLTEHKRHIFEDYICNDLSLGEIAEIEGISRQGVHDIIKRCSAELRTYEEKLQLYRKFEEAKKRITQIQKLTNELLRTDSTDSSISDNTRNNYQTILQSINEITDHILKEL